MADQTWRSYAVRVALGLEPRFEPSEQLKREAARRLSSSAIKSWYRSRFPSIPLTRLAIWSMVSEGQSLWRPANSTA